MKKRVGIIGATGYIGYELIKLIEGRNDIELAFCNTENSKIRDLSEIYPEYKGSVKLTNYSIKEINEIKPDIVFIAMRDGYASQVVDKLESRIIDLSKDHRLSEKGVYGLPEMNRERIKGAKLVSNPGCYATGCILGSLPVVKNNMCSRIIYDCKSGYSGAGRSPSYLNDPKHYTNNIIAYKISRHPHVEEIKYHLGFNSISFTPHVIPIFRGIMCTLHIILSIKIKESEVFDLYKEYYKDEIQIDIVNYLPELHDIQYTNKCCIGGFEIDEENRLVIVVTLDNLLKGGSGQAVENMNIMMNYNKQIV